MRALLNARPGVRGSLNDAVDDWKLGNFKTVSAETNTEIDCLRHILFDFERAEHIGRHGRRKRLKITEKVFRANTTQTQTSAPIIFDRFLGDDMISLFYLFIFRYFGEKLVCEKKNKNFAF